MRVGNKARSLVCVGSLFVLGWCGGAANAVFAQKPDDEEQSRQVFAAEFLNARPATQTRRSPSTRAVKDGPNPASDLLGVTIWRLRPAASSDDTQARLLEHEADTDTVLVAERVPSDTKFKEGQKVRLSIESPRTGYLYVIDREQYADGTFSDPYLIFPTLKIRNGDNAVSAGRLIEIPDQEDHPFYFKMKRNRAEQVGEVLTVLVTSQPIPSLQLGKKALKLTNEQFAQWEQKWKAPAKRVELANHAGKPYTKAEMTAGAGNNSLLRRDDPPPQTIYRISAKPGDALLITLSLQYETTK
jgi:hypothetical protein